MSYLKMESQVPLLNCPFCNCGSEPYLCCIEEDGIPELEPIYTVMCACCGAKGPNRDTPMAAESWWNRKHKTGIPED